MTDNTTITNCHIVTTSSESPLRKNINYRNNKIICHSVAGSLASLSLQVLHPFDI